LVCVCVCGCVVCVSCVCVCMWVCVCVWVCGVCEDGQKLNYCHTFTTEDIPTPFRARW
jgi:hypothetical protein